MDLSEIARYTTLVAIFSPIMALSLLKIISLVEITPVFEVNGFAPVIFQ
jgi:hypothetical protein